MNTSDKTAVEKMDSQYLQIPASIPDDSIIACIPEPSSKDFYWIAKIISTHSTNPLTYKVRYYDWSGNSHAWILMRGKRAYGIFSIVFVKNFYLLYITGTCPHEGVLLYGVQFNNNGTLTAATQNHLNYVLTKNK